jgi:hypothetical protein
VFCPAFPGQIIQQAIENWLNPDPTDYAGVKQAVLIRNMGIGNAHDFKNGRQLAA